MKNLLQNLSARKFLASAAALLVACTGSFAQSGSVSLTSSPYLQNFNSLSSGMPTGWAVYSGARVNLTGTEATVTTTPSSTTAWNQSGGGFKNYASATGQVSTMTATDQQNAGNRALGIRPTAAFDPGAAFLVKINGTKGRTLTEVSFDFQVLDNQPRTTRWRVQFATGTTPGTWNHLAVESASPSITVSANDTAFYSPTGFGSWNVKLKSAALSTLSNIDDVIWLRIVSPYLTFGSGNRDSQGFDNFKISFTGTPTAVAANTPSPATPLAGDPFSVTARLVNADGIQVNNTVRSLSISKISGPGALTGGTTASTVRADSNHVTFSGLSLSSAGSYQLEIAATGTPAVTPATVNLVVSAGLASEPTIPSTVSASNITYNSADLTFTGGDGVQRLVVVKENGGFSGGPADGSSYNASSVFGSGDMVDGGYVVFSGTAAPNQTVSVTNLKQNRTYAVRVYEFNGSDPGSQNYLTNSFGPTSFTPAQFVLGAGDVLVTQFKGDSPDRAGFVTTKAIPAYTRFNVTDNAWNQSTARFVAGGETVWTYEVGAAGLAAGETFSMGADAVTKGSIVTGGSFTGLTEAQDQVIVYQKRSNSDSSFIYAFSNNAFITTGTATASTSYVPTGLTLGTSAVSLNNNGTVFLASYNTPVCGEAAQLQAAISTAGNWLVNTTSSAAWKSDAQMAALINFTSLPAEPSVPATGLTLGTKGFNSQEFSWTNGNGGNRLVVVRQGTQIIDLPVDGTTYTANTNFGQGTDIGNNTYVVYYGPADNVTVTNLLAGTIYTVAVFEASAGSCTNFRQGNSARITLTTLSRPTQYYSKATGNLSDPATYGDLPDGSLSNPVFALTSFDIPNIALRVANRSNVTLDANMTINGSNARLFISGGVKLTVPSNLSLSFTNGATLRIDDNAEVEFVDPASLDVSNISSAQVGTLTINTAGDYTVPNPANYTYGTLKLTGNGNKIFSGSASTPTYRAHSVILENTRYTFGQSPFTSIQLTGNYEYRGTVTANTPGDTLRTASSSRFPSLVTSGNGFQRLIPNGNRMFLFNLTSAKTDNALAINGDVRLYGSLNLNMTGNAAYSDGRNNVWVGGSATLTGPAANYRINGTMIFDGLGATAVTTHTVQGATGARVLASLGSIRLVPRGTGSSLVFASSGTSDRGEITINGDVRIVNNGIPVNTLNINGHTLVLTGSYVSEVTPNSATTPRSLRFAASSDNMRMLMVPGTELWTNITVDAGAMVPNVSGTFNLQGNLNVSGMLNSAANAANFSILNSGTTQTFGGSGTVHVYDVLVNGGTTVTISNANFRIYNLFSVFGTTTTGTNVTLVSTAARTARLASGSTFFTAGSELNVQRYLSPVSNYVTGRYYFLSSPVLGKDYSLFASDNNSYAGYSGMTAVGADSITSVWDYDPANPTRFNGWFKPATLALSLDPAKGVDVFVRRSMLSTGATFNLMGEPKTGSIMQPLTFCASGCATGSANGFNLIGNPMVSPINWDGVARNNVNSAAYLWDALNQRYAYYVAGTGGVGVNGATNIIAMGQGFIADAASPGATVIFSESDKADVANPTFFRQAAMQYVKMNLSNGINSDEALVFFNTDASPSFEGQRDARKMMNSTVNLATTPVAGQHLAINSMPAIAGNEVLKMFVDGAAGNYSISFTNMVNLPATAQVFLKDNFTGTMTAVTEGMSYNFSINSAAASKGADRFELLYGSAVTATGNLVKKGAFSVYPNPAHNGRFSLETFNLTAKANVNIVDALGRVVYTTELNGVGSKELNTNLANGIYTVICTSGAESFTEKLVIK